jgi:Uma2 family endonuclease
MVFAAAFESEALQDMTRLVAEGPPATTIPASHPSNEDIPPLENGDRLTRPEFERRYDAMPHLKKAELIEGVVHMPSPVRIRHHGRPHAHIMAWLGAYCGATSGVDIADNATVRFDLDNEPQPDALLRLETGGTSRISEDDYVEGPPELVVEVASSSVSIDLHAKLKVYRRSGVQEYVVWAVRDRAVTWLRLVEGRYEPLRPDEQGVLRSEVFPGLWLHTAALLAGDLPALIRCVQEGLGDPAHAAFVQRLAAPRHDAPAEG